MPPILSLNDVSFAYTNDNRNLLPILNAVEFTISSGCSAAIMGPSGSGKSTLLNLMALLERPTKGSIRLAGSDVLAATEAERTALRSQHIGMIFQQHHLLPQCTALENVLLPALASGKKKPDAADLERAEGLLNEIGLADKLNQFPAKLSGGERQRVAIARALMNRPSILLADEPTGSLDEERTHEVMEHLQSLVRNENTAIVLVTHSPEVAQYCQAHYLLKGGILTEESPT